MMMYLNISEGPFDVMFSGEKKNEYRKPGKWITSRLFDKKGNRKNIIHAKIVHGYGNHRPYFVCEFKGFYKSEKNFTMTYSTGFSVHIKKGDYILKLGNIIERYTDKTKNLFDHDSN